MMLRKFLAVIVIGLLSIGIQAQTHVFNKGDVMLNAGIGAPINYGLIPTINVSFEVGAIPTGEVGIVSFGGLAELQFAQYNYYYNGDFTDTKPYFIIGPRASWHLQVFESDQWDVYGGVGFGMAFKGKYNNGNYQSQVSGYGEMFFGGRLMFSPSFGLFAEVGGGSRSFGKFGLTFGL